MNQLEDQVPDFLLYLYILTNLAIRGTINKKNTKLFSHPYITIHLLFIVIPGPKNTVFLSFLKRERERP